MRSPRFADDDRGVSTTLGYVLTLTITAILISGLLIAGGTLIEDQRDRIAEEELSVASEQLASGVNEGDRLAGSTDGGVMRVRIWLPERIAGGSYTLELRNESAPTEQPALASIVATAQGADARATLSLRTSVPVANRTVLGGPLVITHRDADDDGSRELVVNESSGLAPKKPEPAVGAHDEVVFVDADTKELSSVAPDGTVTRYGVDASAIGPKQVDIDGDGLREVPFVDSTNRLRVADADGEVQTLATDAAAASLQNSYNSLVAVGAWDGSTSVYYMNTSDVGPNDEATIYRVGIDSDPEQVTVGGAPVEANAIAGIGDLNDDGDDDLAFVGLSQNVWYIDDGSEIDTGQTVGADVGMGVGAPRQFADGEVDRVPFVDSNNVRLLSHQGGTASIEDRTTGGVAASTYVAGIDWAGDAEQEVVFVAASDGTLQYVAADGSITAVTDSDGDTITADEAVGVA